jgi:hypothetical protein
MAVIHHDHGDNCLTMCGVRAVVSVVGRKHLWLVVVGHVFRFHWKGNWRWNFEVKCTHQVEECLEEWVKAEVGAELQPVVCVCYVMIVFGG